MPILIEYKISTPRVIYAVYPSKKHLPKKTKMLVDFIKEKARQMDLEG